MREIDKLECWAIGRSPRQALRVGLRTSHECWTATKEGRPIAMLGVQAASLMGGQGVPWLLGTDEVYRHGRALMRLGPLLIGHWLRDFRVLENVVASRNAKAIRLLQRWGFAIGDGVQNHRGVDFVPFRLERPAVIVSNGPGLPPQHLLIRGRVRVAARS
jgi:hypothetical protein